MPRYYFHFSHGKRTFTDSDGVELAGIASARTHATNQIRNMMATMPGGRLHDWSGWTMMVSDAKEEVFFVVSFELTPRTR
jgi:hypothetical protein